MDARLFAPWVPVLSADRNVTFGTLISADTMTDLSEIVLAEARDAATAKLSHWLSHSA